MDEKCIYGVKSVEELQWCSEFCKIHWKGEKEHILRIAEEVCVHKFLFDLNWDMEQTCEIVEFKEEIDWEVIPFGDPEFTYQLCRHRYFLCLGQAYQLTKDEKYAICFKNLFYSFLNANPITKKKQKTVWRTIEAGIRAENWIKSIPYFYHSRSIKKEDWDMFEQALTLHGKFLYKNNNEFTEKSNWGIIESHGLYMIAACCPHLDKSGKWKSTAIERLCAQLETQVMGDGVHWEQSPMYHNEVLKCCLEVLRVARLTGDKLPEVISNITRKMSYVNLSMRKPNHCQPVMGDSDETDVRDVLTCSACEFSDFILKSGGYEWLDFESVWDYGKEKALEYELISSVYDNTESGIVLSKLNESGNYFLRSQEGEHSDYLHFAAGSLGGGHGHMDKLHIDLSLSGKDILVDSGRYTYVDTEERKLLKSAYSHNVPMVDGTEYTKCLDSWSVSGATSTTGCYIKQKGIFTYMECGHLGYFLEGVYIRRKILAIGTNLYIILDEFIGTGCHSYEQLFHFHPEAKIKRNKNSVICQRESVRAMFYVLSNNCKVEKKSCKLSRHYNQLENSEKVIVSKKAEGNASLLTVIAGGSEEVYQVEKIPVLSALSGMELSDNEAEAIFISGNGSSYEVIFCHQEAGGAYDYVKTDSAKGLGQVMVCDLQAEKKETIVLKW